MADTKPSAFTTDSTPDDLDVIPYIDLDGGGAGVHLPRKLTYNDLTAYLESRARVHRALTSNLSIGAADTLALAIPVPNGRIQAQTKFKFEFIVSKTAAGTGTPTINVRFGTAGTTADTSRCLLTWPAANTAAIDRMKMTVLGTFRSVGSGTSAVIQGELAVEHQLTTTGFGGTGTGANMFVSTTGGGFDSTVASSFLSLTINGSTGAVWTASSGHGVVENLA